jgi:hypothetical protein
VPFVALREFGRRHDQLDDDPIDDVVHDQWRRRVDHVHDHVADDDPGRRRSFEHDPRQRRRAPGHRR